MTQSAGNTNRALPRPIPMALTSTIYSSPVFQQACNQFDAAADILGMDAGLRERTKRPRRCVVVSMPVRMDDGRTTVVSQSDLGGIREGSMVRVYNGRAWVR